MLGKIKSKYGRRTFIYNISKKENINRLEADRLYQPAPVTLAKMEVDANNHRKFMYDVSLCISLKEYFKQYVDSEKVVDLLKQFIVMTSECEKLKLNIDKVILNDFKYIFYEKISGQLKFIYIPVQNVKVVSDTDTLKQFVINLLSNPIYKPDTDMTVISEIMVYISSELHFNIKSLSAFIEKINNPEEEIASIDYGNPARFMSIKSENMSSANPPQNDTESSSTDFETTDMTDLPNEEFLTEDTSENDEFLTQDTIIYEGILERQITNEEIIISKTPFTIGRYENGMPVEMKPDYCLNSKKISRPHIMIYQKSGEEYEPDIFEIYDERSHNRTYINGELLEHKKYLKLSDGDKIMIPGEVFIFHIREK